MSTKQEIFDFKNLSDDRGSLVAIESGRTIPFEIKRVFYLFELNVEGTRGFHAHHQQRQLIVCMHGSCDLVLDDGTSRRTFHLESPAQGILIDRMVWNEMSGFSEGCVLMVMADDHYDETDYIRDYETFKKAVRDSSAK